MSDDTHDRSFARRALTATTFVEIVETLVDDFDVIDVIDVLTVLASRCVELSAIREGRLQNALTSRIAIEQAKGMIAERAGVNMDQAFAKLRAYARSTIQRLTEVATGLVGGTVSMDAINRE